MDAKEHWDIKVNDVSGPFTGTEPIASPNYVIGICHEGRFEADYDFQHVDFVGRQIAVVYPNHILLPTSVSENYRATIIDVPSDVFYSMLKHFVGRDHFRHETAPCFPLNDDQYNTLMHLVDALRAIDHIGCNAQLEMKHMMTEVIIETVNHYYSLIVPDSDQMSSGMLSKRFFKAVIDNCAEHHDVTFYANYFNLSPKYFSTAIARETGHNALYWIQFYLAAKAKQILYLQSDKPLKFISDELGFSEFSAFSRFFKHVVGVSPSEWRKRTVSASKKD